MTAPPPIRIPCEGSLQPGHKLDRRAICTMCGRIVDTIPAPDPSSEAIIEQHDRDDIISMLQRGDFG